MVIFQSTLELLWNVGELSKNSSNMDVCTLFLLCFFSFKVIEVKDTTEQTHSSLYGGSLMCHKASTVFQGNHRIPLGVKNISKVNSVP